jgi:hypothetical protein
MWWICLMLGALMFRRFLLPVLGLGAARLCSCSCAGDLSLLPSWVAAIDEWIALKKLGDWLLRLEHSKSSPTPIARLVSLGWYFKLAAGVKSFAMTLVMASLAAAGSR